MVNSACLYQCLSQYVPMSESISVTGVWVNADSKAEASAQLPVSESISKLIPIPTLTAVTLTLFVFIHPKSLPPACELYMSSLSVCLVILWNYFVCPCYFCIIAYQYLSACKVLFLTIALQDAVAQAVAVRALTFAAFIGKKSNDFDD